ncbi:MAG TPA: DUF1501 domain-containing protein [Stellaceae bacterium]|nr:DUF1501 domain-containing protein [Stellaceae bacterium]
MPLSRRTLLKSAAAGAIVASAPGLTVRSFAAPTRERPLLVVVHLRGGADGLNLVSPATDPDFIATRTSELRVAADGSEAGYALANGPDGTIDFRLHPAAGGLAELYKSGALAIIHAAGLTDGTRSHFVATDMIERGVADGASLSRLRDGWLTRYLRADPASTGPIAAVSAAGAVSGELAEWPDALAVADLSGGLAPAGGPQAREVLTRLYATGKDPVSEAGRSALSAMATIDAAVPRDPKGAVIPYHPDAAAPYDSAAEFGRPLRTLAQLIKMELGVDIATVDIGGWDMHEYQPGRFKTGVTHLSNGIAAFWNDTARYHDRMVLVTISEFGRRLRSNRSLGTDHGRAGVMMVLGGRVKGGRFFGRWPGLANAQLDEGVDLAVATDYRQILTEILRHRGAAPADRIFPGYVDKGPLGIFGA